MKALINKKPQSFQMSIKNGIPSVFKRKLKENKGRGKRERLITILFHKDKTLLPQVI
jgi:hypothetical protein